MAIKVPSSGPRSQLWLLQGDCSQRWNSLEKKVTDHPLNHAVELLVPGTNTLPSNLGHVLDKPPSYYKAHLPLSHLIRPEIISRYLLVGSLTALSVGRRIDIDNVYALLPTGKLIMSVDKDTYEQLGLQGKPSRYVKNQRFIVELDLVAPHFKPGKPNYERVKWCLSDRLDLEGDFVITWTSTDQASLETQFLQDFKATKHNCTSDREILENFTLPTILGDHPHGLVKDDRLLSCPVEELHTWLGAVANCGLSKFYEGSAPDDYVSTFIPPEPNSTCQYGTRTRWTGMMSSSYIVSLLEKIRDYLSSGGKASNTPWIVVNIWGFEDSPISWRNIEHGHFLSGDNHCSIVIFNTGHYWCLSMLSNHDFV